MERCAAFDCLRRRRHGVSLDEVLAVIKHGLTRSV
jgi:hypothetical protein